MVSVDSGLVRYKLREEEDIRTVEEDDAVVVPRERFTAFALHPSGKFVTSCSDSRLVRHWELGETSAALKKSWRGQESPVLCAAYHVLGDLFATGGSDGSVKVWSVSGGYCTHNFRGHKAVVTALQFHPDAQCLHLYSGDNAGGLRRWSLMHGKDMASIDPIYRKFSTEHAGKCLRMIRVICDDRTLLTLGCSIGSTLQRYSVLGFCARWENFALRRKG